MIGDTKRTMEISAQLFDRGIFLSGIRPPTVPEGESRLRLTVTATHTMGDIEKLLSAIRQRIG
jgi:7-keto-8-aminopelargonate synthetase-like enzyme